MNNISMTVPSDLAVSTAEENTFIKRTFTNFEKATRGNQAVQTAVMEIAYAIAGTRETGKLTDKAKIMFQYFNNGNHF